MSELSELSQVCKVLKSSVGSETVVSSILYSFLHQLTGFIILQEISTIRTHKSYEQIFWTTLV